MLGPIRVALYCRVSSEDQAERGTIGSQRKLLQDLAATFGWIVAGLYEDDGVSGTVPLASRPAGARLLADGAARNFAEVVVFRIDRLARSLSVLLDAQRALDQAGVALRSATEPFDTSTSVGKLLFQLLGSFAEFERSSMQERMTLGRDRVARDGKWTGGPIPYGYTVDDRGGLQPSQVWVEQLGLTEADVVRSIFQRIADGSSLVREAQRLNGLQVPSPRRWTGAAGIERIGFDWAVTRLSRMIRSRLYAGASVLNSRNQPVERPVPALIDERLWAKARAQLGRNRALSDRSVHHVYLLRGLIVCGQCGSAYVGCASGIMRGNSKRTYYRCSSYMHRRSHLKVLCSGIAVVADHAEDLVWQDCRAFILNPDDALAVARAELEQRHVEVASVQIERERLEREILAKQVERDRAMTLYRRGRVTLEEAEAQLDQVMREQQGLQVRLAAFESRATLATANQEALVQAKQVLRQLSRWLPEIEQGGDQQMKRQFFEALIGRVTVDTHEENGRRQARLRVRYTFSGPATDRFVIGTPTENVTVQIGVTRELAYRSSRGARG